MRTIAPDQNPWHVMGQHILKVINRRRSAAPLDPAKTEAKRRKLYTMSLAARERRGTGNTSHLSPRYLASEAEWIAYGEAHS